MIPFVAAGGLLIALGFLLGGYEIALDDPSTGNSWANNWVLNNSTCGTCPPARVAAPARRPRRLPRRDAASSSARRRSRFFVPALAGYIAYAIADRPGIAPGFMMGGLVAASSVERRLPRRPSSAACSPASSRYWIAGWKVPPWARGLMPVRGHPAARPRSSPASSWSSSSASRSPWLMTELTDWPEQPDRQPARPARRHPRPDDGLRHGRPAEQGRLQLRHRRPRRGWTACPTTHRPAEDHGHGHARRHGAADRAGPGHRRPAAAVHRGRAGERQGRPGCSAPRSSPRARSRSPRPTRCG